MLSIVGWRSRVQAHFFEEEPRPAVARVHSTRKMKNPLTAADRATHGAFYQICARRRSRRFRPIFVGREPLGTFGTQLC